MQLKHKVKAKHKGDKRIKSIIKSFTWEIISSFTTILVIYLITKNIEFSIGIGIITFFIKIFLYYFHERYWNKVHL